MFGHLTRRGVIRTGLAAVGAVTVAGCAALRRAASTTAAGDEGSNDRPPNIILILCDNLGYGDVGAFGNTVHRTPHIDRLAAEGVRLTHFYSTSGVCTPSRASIMTGCYPRRINLHADEHGALVLQPIARKGLNPDEVTVAEVLKSRGYATAIIGKWHLGDQPRFLPTRQGFDAYLGIPYSDDMTARPGQPWPPLPLMRDERVIDAPVDRTTLTGRYTEEAVRFITAHRDRPFFLFLSHATPGSTTKPDVGDAFRGKSKNGAWGDSVEELDWSTGELMAALARLGLDEKTLVVWTSDNGAPRRQPPQGSNAPLAGWGYTTDEGGMRIPCIAHWTGRIPPGRTCAELATTMDFLPTFARLAGAEPPKDRVIDGHDIGPLLAAAPGAASPYEAFYFYDQDQLQAVRAGRWKLYLPLPNKKGRGRKVPASGPGLLFDLVADVAEKHNVAAEHLDVVERLTALVGNARDDLGDGPTPGKHQRPAGWEPNPTPRVMES
ncbi:MAG: sulfatase [Planctomycetes bacterium]|nr:sulfatase [Planctomycetota bacterium]